MLLLPVGLLSSPIVVAGLLLDSIATVGAFSMRRLRTGYAGPCIRVRRSSDNAEMDIGFTSGGDLDTATLLAFCGSGSGYVSKWYDQSGAANHMFQTVASSQMIIVSSGSLVTRGGKPCVSAVSSSGNNMVALPSGMFSALTSSTAICAFTNDSNESGWLNISSASNSNLVHTPYLDNNAYENYLSYSRSTFSGYGPISGVTIHTAHNTGSALSVYRNGNLIGSPAAVTFAPNPTNLGSNSQGQWTLVSLQEIILTSAALSTANRQTIERSMGTYFGVTVA